MSRRRWFLPNSYTPRRILRCPECRLTYSGYHIPPDEKCTCGASLVPLVIAREALAGDGE